MKNGQKETGNCKGGYSMFSREVQELGRGSSWRKQRKSERREGGSRMKREKGETERKAKGEKIKRRHKEQVS